MKPCRQGTIHRNTDKSHSLPSGSLNKTSIANFKVAVAQFGGGGHKHQSTFEVLPPPKAPSKVSKRAKAVNSKGLTIRNTWRFPAEETLRCLLYSKAAATLKSSLVVYNVRCYTEYALYQNYTNSSLTKHYYERTEPTRLHLRLLRSYYGIIIDLDHLLFV